MQTTNDSAQQRAYGITIIVAMALMLAFMSHHPTGHGAELGELVENISAMATSGRIVHGALIAVVCLLAVGFSGVADLLGRRRWLVRTGWIAFVAGTAAMVLAALINGFGVTGLAERFANGNEDESLEGLRAALVLAHELNQAATWIGLVGWVVTIASWSAAMLARAGTVRRIGAGGLGGVGILGVLAAAGHIAPTVHGLLAFLVIFAAWSLAIAVLLIRRSL